MTTVPKLTDAGSAFSAGGNIRGMANLSGDFAGDVAECADRYRKGMDVVPADELLNAASHRKPHDLPSA